VAAPTITSAASATFTAGTAGTFSVTTTGFNAGQYGITAAAVELVSPQPAIAPSTQQVLNNSGGPVAVVITGGTLTFVFVNGAQAGTAAGTYLVPAGGNISITYSVAPTWTWYDADGSPALPINMTFTDNGSGGATIAGTPGDSAGIYPILITANNLTPPNALQVFILTQLKAVLPPNKSIICPRCTLITGLFLNIQNTQYLCPRCEWRFTLGTKAPTGVTNAGVAAGAVALPMASGGAAFTTGMVLVVDTGNNAEVTTVVAPGGTGTSVPVQALAKPHLTAAAFGQISLAVTYGSTGEEAVPVAPSWGF
jgi:hypothetical protein